MKMKILHTKKIITSPHQNLDISKWVVRSQELSFVSSRGDKERIETTRSDRSEKNLNKAGW